MTAVPSVTVVVPTCNRFEDIARCTDSLLAAVAASTTPVDGIVVVANGPGHDQVELPGVQVLREPVASASRARNLGLASVASDVVAFVDDDVTVSSGWLDALVAPFTRPEVVAAVGPITLDFNPARPRWLVDDLQAWFSAVDLGSETRVLDADEYGWTANMAVRRSAVLAIGGFDLDLGPGTRQAFGEDSDLIDRLRDEGGQLVYAHRATTQHHVGAERLQLRWLAGRTYRQGMTDVVREQRRGLAPEGHHPVRAARSLAGAVRWGLPQLVRTARDPAQRPAVVAEQVALYSARLGAARSYLTG